MSARRRLLGAVGAVACLALPAAAAARDNSVTAADVSMRLAPDAALIVNERLTFAYEGSYQASFRDILLRKGERISDAVVSEGQRAYRAGGCTDFGCTDQAGRFGVTTIPEGGGVRIVWHHKASDESRTFDLRYRVEDAVVAHEDVLDLEWQVWGDQWEFDLPKLRASLTDAALDPASELYRVWGKPRDVEGESFRDPGVARLEASDVRDHQFVEMRVTIPRTPAQGVGAARVEPGEGLPAILDQEAQNDEDYNSAFNKTKRFLANNAALLALVLGGLTLAALVAFSLMAREHPASAPRHLPEPPDDASPALAFGLAYEGDDSENTVLATLLDLVDRGYYEAKATNAEGEKLDLSLAVAAKRPRGDLEQHEKQVLDFFDELLESDTVAMSEMKDRIPEHSSTWRSRWEGMTSALDSVDEGQLAWDRDFNPIRWLFFVGLIAPFGLIILADLSVNEEWFAPALIAAVALAATAVWPRNVLRRLSPDYRERSARWQAFARWTKDFPSLEDDPPATLELWRRILVFGVAFGTAQRMIESGRIPAPVLESAGDTWSGTYLHGGLHETSFRGSSFSSGFASQVAPESSSGGGGGFSGGGGGGSGGGGGGSW